MRPTALLHSALQNLLAGTHRFGEHRAFLEIVGDRLFQIHVLAGRDRIQRHAEVPVIGGGNDHRIDILVVQDLAVIEMRGGESARALFEEVAMRSIDVTDCHDLARRCFIRGLNEPLHALAGSNQSEPDLFIGAKNARGSKRRHSSCDDETATIDHVSSTG